MNIVITSIVILGAIGCLSAVILYFVAKKFKVEQDDRIDQIVEVLPGANCGGCGFAGCQGFATACVKAGSLENKFCPVGGAPVMQKVGSILGVEASEVEPMVAVVRCNGTCANRPKTNTYDGAKNCRIAASHYAGETACGYGCLGFGDCAAACNCGAIKVNPETGIVEIDEELCVGCGACAKACPHNVIEIRKKGLKGRRVYVGCVNKDKGAVARKACKAACIGCGKCEKTCPFGAIKVENNVAYIDFNVCKLCRKCVVECPTGAIKDVNFPTPPVKPAPKPVEEKKTVEEAKPVEPKVEEVKVEEVKVEEVRIEEVKTDTLDNGKKPDAVEQSLF
ncbi:MAG: Fe-S cluster domain-containing protein [Paludibacteraceae bacterium]|nr:Fe-S cluster domain-containing protein [Paludibacteraceae bacterium]